MNVYGTTTFRITTISIMPRNIIDSMATVSINNTQHKN